MSAVEIRHACGRIRNTQTEPAMALSTVDILTYCMRSDLRKVLSAALVALYGALSLTSHFPALHNHGPTARDACCCKAESCCEIPHRHVPHRPSTGSRYTGQPGHAHGPCMACMWQATAKRQAESYVALPATTTPLLLREYEIPNEVLHYSTSPRLQQPRAPPA